MQGGTEMCQRGGRRKIQWVICITTLSDSSNKVLGSVFLNIKDIKQTSCCILVYLGFKSAEAHWKEWGKREDLRFFHYLGPTKETKTCPNFWNNQRNRFKGIDRSGFTHQFLDFVLRGWCEMKTNPLCSDLYPSYVLQPDLSKKF